MTKYKQDLEGYEEIVIGGAYYVQSNSDAAKINRGEKGTKLAIRFESGSENVTRGTGLPTDFTGLHTGGTMVEIDDPFAGLLKHIKSSHDLEEIYILCEMYDTKEQQDYMIDIFKSFKEFLDTKKSGISKIHVSCFTGIEDVIKEQKNNKEFMSGLQGTMDSVAKLCAGIQKECAIECQIITGRMASDKNFEDYFQEYIKPSSKPQPTKTDQGRANKDGKCCIIL